MSTGLTFTDSTGAASVRCAPGVYLRRRVAVALVAAACVFGVARQAGAAFDGVSSSGGAASSPRSAPTTITYVVKPGDTLWSIARRLAPREDPRGIVDLLRDSRDSDTLIAGETIVWVVD